MGDVIQRTDVSSLRVTDGRPHVVLTGFPYDEGTRRNGGRVGAEDGPEVVRRFGRQRNSE